VSRPLSVLLVGDYPPDATLGSPKVFFKLQAELQALGHRCDVIFGEEIGGPRFRQVRQVVSPWYAANAIARRLDRARYDIVDAASAEGLWFAAAKRMGAFPGTSFICRSNGLEHLNYRRMLLDAEQGLTRKPWTRRIWYPLTRLSQVAAAARLADGLIVLNDADRTYALENGWQPEDRIHLVAHGVSTEFLADPGSSAPRGKGLLFCGTWDRMKGIDALVAAFEQLCSEHPGLPLTILGPGVCESAVLRSFSETARRFVTVIPRAPEQQVIEAYRGHDVLLWPSTYEGFGLVLLEAMSQRMAVVATPVGCAPAVVRDGENGLCVSARDARALAAAARRLMDDTLLRERLGNAARDTVKSMTWRATALRTLDAYGRAREERKAA
jgi:glycosyltransferase involved in cell wall biosynthesis